MPYSKDFIRAWYQWQRTTVPVANFRLHRTDAPTYDLEHDLDHLASYVYSLGLKAIGKETADYAKLAAQELVELEQISSKLETCAISGNVKDTLVAYISATRRMLEALTETPTVNPESRLEQHRP